jgi:hypothetical protein
MSAEAVLLPARRQTASERFFKLALAFGIGIAVLEGAYLCYSKWPYDVQGYMVGRDFVNAWVGAKLAWTSDPGAFFGIKAYTRLLADTFYPGFPFHIWSYPPHILLFIWPFAFLPYLTAYVLYCLFGWLLYVAVVSDGDRRADHLLLIAFAPAVTVNIWTGQNGFLVAVLLFGGLLQLDRRPVLAGVMFGLLSIKPQLGLLLPLVLVLMGRWRTIVSAAATVAALVAATTAIWGTQVWAAYWYDAMPTQSRVVLEGFSSYMVHMPTAFMNAKTMWLPVWAAASIQAVASAVTVAAVVWTFWRKRDADLSLALLITATFTVTPYAFNYDMVLFSGVIVRLMDRADNDRWDYALMLLVWVTPFFTIPLGVSHMPLSFAAIFAFGVKLVWRLWMAERSNAAPSAVAQSA